MAPLAPFLSPVCVVAMISQTKLLQTVVAVNVRLAVNGIGKESVVSFSQGNVVESTFATDAESV